ncbi:MAG: hypothetical protein ACLTJ5_06755 [Clostridium sp.]
MSIILIKGDLLRRIPLHKGKNHRDIVDESTKAEIVRNTYNENGFTQLMIIIMQGLVM